MIIRPCVAWFTPYDTWLKSMSERIGLHSLKPAPGSRKPRKRVDKTTAHRDHIHIGMTKAGANGRTSFWAAR